jgi:4'-phosphopantetheinyl transferase
MSIDVIKADLLPGGDSQIALDRDVVSIWWADLDWFDTAITSALSDLSSDECERANRYHRLVDRSRFIAARSCLRRILGWYVDVSPDLLTFEHGQHGKPRLGGDAAFHDVRFNLAHSDKMAVFAVAIGRELGIDLEWIGRDVSCLEIARRMFAPVEQQALETLTGEDRVRAFYRCWTRKEAYVKATGAGLSVPLDSFTVSVLPGDVCCVGPNSVAPDHSCRLIDISSNAEFAATLALFDSVKPLPRIVHYRWPEPFLNPGCGRLEKKTNESVCEGATRPSL